MLDILSGRLFAWANPKILLILFLVLLPFNAILFPSRTLQLRALSGQADPILDARLAYTPSSVYTLMTSLGESGRRLYVLSELTVDLIYPILYNSMLSLVMAFVFRRAWSNTSPLQRLPLLPLAGLLADYGENASLVILFLKYPDQLVFVAQLASLLTSLKWLVGAASLSLIVAGLVRLLLFHREAGGA